MNAPRSQKSAGATANGSVFGRLLRDWRGRRGFSQLDLALAARTTQRHLSFIESGRATPSRAMILRLAVTMSLPLRQQNELMLAAGYAPAWRDRCWNLLRANRGAMNMTEFLLGPASADSPSEPVNLAVALLSHDGLRPFIINWQEVALYFVRGVQADAHADGTPETADLLARLLAFPDVRALSETTPPEEEGQSPVLPIHFLHDGTSLRLFTTIATLGTPRDVTLQEVRIEFFFPMDEMTAQALGAWAQQTRPTAQGSMR